MDLYEYQARELLERHAVPVLAGILATTPAEAEEAARHFDTAVVVKAQVKTGGRGKAGGVKLAHDPAEARQLAQTILGMDIKGHVVHSVLVTPAAEIAKEFYVSILLDRSNRTYLAMASVQGGMEIEQLAREHPEALARVPVDVLAGLDAASAAEIVRAGGFPDEIAPEVAGIVQHLWEVLLAEDATLVEINPLVETADGRILALDGKITLDDNADFRHPEDAATFADRAAIDPLEQAAKDKHLHYVKLDGQVGIIGNGAGLVMSTLDVVANAGRHHGGMRPANFLDIGGGASAKVMSDALSVILSDPQVQAVFVNVFGGITSCDEVARGIVGALDLLGDKATKALVVRLDGNAVEAGRQILRDAAYPLVHMAPTMDEAAELVAAFAERANRSAH